ncbi:tRNA (adenine(22)-N(1))-methyltransferase [Peptostreptococcus equinus]|uniref:Class I SAM-dependent methyltransferase n=1 Tax=Peptostreptococcus equinus TaxID=3003601 RepID=A0ABY7JKV6_9FIRM|nr:class I SAM-dependent methyltransferase [Peptostreptococcus sp. CBA3647]WAW13990.1 class I SAM-dependent methyltransferase [Peptostreptococcus sp. CBA3647]
MRLTPRLEKIASLVDNKVKLADIGTDHGYIPVSLLLKNTIEYAILSDINKGPLENARKEVTSLNLDAKVDLRLGSGLEILEDGEVDQIIIAGMGGILISELIENKKELCKKLSKMILQPMQAQDELRKYLEENKFRIIDEHMVSEDFRIYEILEVVYDPEYEYQKLDSIYYEVSKILLDKKEPLLIKLIEKKIYECNSIIEKLTNNENIDLEKISNRLDFIKIRKNKLDKLKKLVANE